MSRKLREFTVETETVVYGTIVVRATSPEEAREMVENGEFENLNMTSDVGPQHVVNVEETI
jgi:hypothetical protein